MKIPRSGFVNLVEDWNYYIEMYTPVVLNGHHLIQGSTTLYSVSILLTHLNISNYYLFLCFILVDDNLFSCVFMLFWGFKLC